MGIKANTKGSRATSQNDYRIINARNVNKKKYPNGCIYIINLENTDYYKVGVSQNPDRRISDLSSATPFNVLVLYCEYYKNVYDIEEQIHKQFKNNYIKSEWFEIDFEVIFDFIKKLNDKKIENINQQLKLL